MTNKVETEENIIRIRFAGLNSTDDEATRKVVSVNVKLRREQSNSVRYFLKFSGSDVVTNSAMVVVRLKENNIAADVHHHDRKCRESIEHERRQINMVACIASAMDEQIKTDTLQVFMCSAYGLDIDTQQVAEANAGKEQCHVVDRAVFHEVAWGDVNECKLYPAKHSLGAECRDGILEEYAGPQEGSEASRCQIWPGTMIPES